MVPEPSRSTFSLEAAQSRSPRHSSRQPLPSSLVSAPWREKGFANRLVTLEVHDVTDADARGSEPVTRGGVLVGRTTSGGYGWRVDKSLALAMVTPEFASPGQELNVRILGEPHRATVVADSPYDPANAALRS